MRNIAACSQSKSSLLNWDDLTGLSGVDAPRGCFAASTCSVRSRAERRLTVASETLRFSAEPSGSLEKVNQKEGVEFLLRVFTLLQNEPFPSFCTKKYTTVSSS